MLKYSYLLCLCTFLSFSFLMRGQSNSFQAELQPEYYHKVLEDQFQEYSVYSMAETQIADYVESRSGVIPFSLNLGKEYRWNLEIMPNIDLFSPDFKMQVATQDGSEWVEVKNIAYKGWNTGNQGGAVRLCIDENYLFGFIETGKEKIYIEPLRNYVDGAEKNQLLVYRPDDVIIREEYSCALVDEKHMKENILEHLEEEEAKGNSLRMPCKELDLAIATDWLMVTEYGSCGGVSAHITSILNNVQADWDDEFATEIVIRQVTHFCSSCSSCDPWTSSLSPFALLNDFTSWGPSGFGVVHDMGQLWTNRQHSGIIGIAWLNAVCTSIRYHVNWDFTTNGNLLRQLASHEMGHNFSATHDPPGSPYIMAPVINGSSIWSTMTVNQINNWINISGCLSACASSAPLSITCPGSPPDIDGCEPEDVTIQYPNLPYSITPISIDESDFTSIGGSITAPCGVVQLEYSDEVDATDCSWEITRTFVVYDDCGSSSSCTQEIYIEDTSPPTITTPAQTMTVECDGDGNLTELNDWLTNYGGAMGVDNCSSTTIYIANQDFIPICGAAGRYLVRFALEDECNNTAFTSAQFIIVDTKEPVLLEEAKDNVVECDGSGNTAELQGWLASNGGAEAYDRCSNAPIWTNDYNPANFVPLCGNTGYVDVTFTPEDECGNIGKSTSARFTIVDTTPPSIDVPASDLSVQCGEKTATTTQTYWLQNLAGAQASDICSGITWSTEFLMQNEICESTGSVTFAFIATDECGNSSRTVATYTKHDQEPPEIHLPFTAKEQACGTEPQWGYVYAEDECDLDVIPLTWTEEVVGGDCDHEYSITRTWVAQDDCGNTSSASQTISYGDDEPPSLVFTEDSPFYGLEDGDTYIVDCSELPPFDEQDVIASDNCTIGFMQVSMEDGEEQGNCIDDGFIARWPWTFTAEDECGNVGSLSITIELVDNSGPEFVSVPADKTIDCLDDVQFGVPEIQDACGSRFNVVEEDVIEDTPCVDAYYERTWIATDVCGNVSSASQRIAQLDREPPEFISVPADQTIGCDDDPMFGDPEVTDNCSDVDVIFIDDDEMGDCDSGYTITRTWIATDGCGNSSSANAVILVIDNSIIVTRPFEEQTEEKSMGVPDVNLREPRVDENGFDPDFTAKLYPNPVKRMLTVEWFASEPGDWTIDVRNIQGQLITFHVTQIDRGLAKFQLEVDDYKSGMYFITIRSKDQRWTNRFIKF